MSYVLVIWSSSPHMCRTIDQPCKVQTQRVPNDNLRKECPEPAFTPAVHWNHNRQYEAKQQFHWDKESAFSEIKILISWCDLN